MASSAPRDCLLLSQRSDPRLLPWGTVLCPTHRLTPAAGFPELTPAALQTHPPLPRSLIHCSGGDSSRVVPVTNNRHPEEARELPSAQELSWKAKPVSQGALQGKRGKRHEGGQTVRAREGARVGPPQALVGPGPQHTRPLLSRRSPLGPWRVLPGPGEDPSVGPRSHPRRRHEMKRASRMSARARPGFEPCFAAFWLQRPRQVT